MALDDQGRVYTWGAGDNGQLGCGASLQLSNAPMRVDSIADRRVRSVHAGGSHSFALCEDGALLAWGNGAAQTLGFEPPGADLVFEPTPVPFFEQNKHRFEIESLVGGVFHTLVSTRQSSTFD
jgi:alpha-tubulin suppressor-like RCC1 family protein